MDKNLTDNEIKKALDYWKKFDAEIDEMMLTRYKGDKDLIKQKEIVKITFEVFDLINRLQAKLDEAEDTIQFADKELKKANAEIERLQAENEVLEARIGVYETCNARKDEAIRHLEAENEKLRNAYKQCAWERDIFAEDMKQEIKKDCSYLMLDIKAIKAEAYKECIEKAKNEIDTQPHSRSLEASGERFRIHKILDNLLKELVGEDNESKN